jgi:hypothetical protein
LMILTGLGCLMCAFGLATATMTSGWPAEASIAVLMGFGACLIGWNGIYMGEAARVSGPAKVGLATGGILMFNFIGVIVFPATFGLIAKAQGSTAATFGLFAVLPLLGAAALIPAIRHERRHEKLRRARI